MNSLIFPEWPAPANVRACSTTRMGGASVAPWQSLNLGSHVGDQPAMVDQNRRRLIEMAGLPGPVDWLSQVHGVDVVTLDGCGSGPQPGDAVYTRHAGQVCAVMTADCLPVLFCNQAGSEVAAAHAGWRGLCNGILEKTLSNFADHPGQIMAWLGPAIGPRAFEVGAEVRDAFIGVDAAAEAAFVASGNKFLADIYHLARLRLEAAGVRQIYGGNHCTVTETALFFSYRRDGVTGRMASLVWLI